MILYNDYEHFATKTTLHFKMRYFPARYSNASK